MNERDELFYIQHLDGLGYCIMIQRDDSNSSVIRSKMSKRNAEIHLTIINDALAWWFEK